MSQPWLGAGQSLDALPRATQAVGTDLIPVQTNSAGLAGQKNLRSMQISNLLQVLRGLSNWQSVMSSNRIEFPTLVSAEIEIRPVSYGWDFYSFSADQVIFKLSNGLPVFPTGLVSDGYLLLRNLTANQPLALDGSKLITSAGISNQELAYIGGTTKPVQEQFEARAKTTNTVWNGRGPTGGAPLLIIDIDFGNDIDDMNNLILAWQMHRRGEIQIIGVIGALTNGWCAPGIDIINREYGHPEVALGANKGTGWNFSPTDFYGTLLATQFVSSVMHKSAIDGRTNVMDAVMQYRTLLAAAPSNSVKILVLGPSRNIYNLMNSGGDAISPLTGAQLAYSRVNEWLPVMCIFPHSSGTAEYNAAADVTGSQIWMTITNKITWSGIELGNPVSLGTGWQTNYPANTPMYRAWNASGFNYRPAWGDLALLYAARGTNWFGASNLFARVEVGTNFIAANGTNIWQGAASTSQGYLVRVAHTNDLMTMLNALLFASPVGGRWPMAWNGDVSPYNLNIANPGRMIVGPNAAGHQAAIVADYNSVHPSGALALYSGTRNIHFFFNNGGLLCNFIDSGNNGAYTLLEYASGNNVGIGIPFGSAPAYKLEVRGDIGLQTIGTGFRVAEGSNAKMGTATLSSGLATVSTTAVGANSRIFLTARATANPLNAICETNRVNGTSFQVRSASNTDGNAVSWLIFDPF